MERLGRGHLAALLPFVSPSSLPALLASAAWLRERLSDPPVMRNRCFECASCGAAFHPASGRDQECQTHPLVAAFENQDSHGEHYVSRLCCGSLNYGGAYNTPVLEDRRLAALAVPGCLRERHFVGARDPQRRLEALQRGAAVWWNDHHRYGAPEEDPPVPSAEEEALMQAAAGMPVQVLLCDSLRLIQGAIYRLTHEQAWSDDSFEEDSVEASVEEGAASVDARDPHWFQCDRGTSMWADATITRVMDHFVRPTGHQAFCYAMTQRFYYEPLEHAAEDGRLVVVRLDAGLEIEYCFARYLRPRRAEHSSPPPGCSS